MVYRHAPTEFGANPLASDDPLLPRTTPTEFGGSPGGLDLQGMPSSPLGLSGMPDPGNDPGIAGLQQMARAPIIEPRPSAAPEGPQIFYSPSTGNMVVNGFEFNQENASAALASMDAARQTPQRFTLPDTASDWERLSPEQYASYLEEIRNPSTARRMGEAWEHAWRGVGDIALGAGSAAVEALPGDMEWEWGNRARASILQEYENNAPFMMQLRDVENVNDGLTWAAQTVIQGAPWLVETLASMTAGALIGGAVGGAPGVLAGGAEGFLAKEALRQATMAAVNQNIRRGALAYAEAAAAAGARTATRQQAIAAAGRVGASADDVERFFNFGEAAYNAAQQSAIRSGARTGATTFTIGSNYMMGVGDIRNTIVDAGGDPQSAQAIAEIWGGALPYALVESAGDLLLTAPLTRVMPDLFGSPGIIRNAAIGAAVNAPSEGVQELVQYGITGSAAARVTGTEFNPEPIDLLEVGLGGALAGAGVGGLMGGVGAIGRRRPDPVDPTTPDAGLAVEDTDPEIPGAPGAEDPLAPATPIPTMPEGYPDNTYIAPERDYPGAPGTEPMVPGGLMDDPYMGPPPIQRDRAYLPDDYPEYPTQGGMEPAISEATGTRPRTLADIYRDFLVGMDLPQQEAQALYNQLNTILRTDPTNYKVIEERDRLRSILANEPQLPEQQAGPLTPLQVTEQALARNEALRTNRVPLAKIGESAPTPQDAAQPTRAAPLPPTVTNQNPTVPDKTKLKPAQDMVRDPATGQLRPATEEEKARAVGRIPADQVTQAVQELSTKSTITPADVEAYIKKQEKIEGKWSEESKRRFRKTMSLVIGEKMTEEEAKPEPEPAPAPTQAPVSELEKFAAELKKLTETLAETRKQLEKPDVQERSPAPKDVEDKPGTGTADGSRDAARDEAPAESATEETNKGVQRKLTKAEETAMLPAIMKGFVGNVDPSIDLEERRRQYEEFKASRDKQQTGDPTPNRDNVKKLAERAAQAAATPPKVARIDKAYRQGMAAYDNAYSFYQGIGGILAHKKDKAVQDKPINTSEKSKWAIVDGVALTPNELRTLSLQLKAESDAAREGAKAVAKFQIDVNYEWGLTKDASKGSPEGFEFFIRDSKPAIVAAWLKTKESNANPRMRATVERIHKANPIQQAATPRPYYRLGPKSGNRDYGIISEQNTAGIPNTAAAKIVELIFNARANIDTIGSRQAIFLDSIGKSAVALFSVQDTPNGKVVFADVYVVSPSEAPSITAESSIQQAATPGRELRQRKLLEAIKQVKLVTRAEMGRTYDTLVQERQSFLPIAWKEIILRDGGADGTFKSKAEIGRSFASLIEDTGPTGKEARAYPPLRPWLSEKAKDMLEEEEGNIQQAANRYGDDNKRWLKLYDLILAIELKKPSPLNKSQEPYLPSDWREQIVAATKDNVGIGFGSVLEVRRTFDALTQDARSDIGRAMREYAPTKGWLSEEARKLRYFDVLAEIDDSVAKNMPEALLTELEELRRRVYPNKDKLTRQDFIDREDALRARSLERQRIEEESVDPNDSVAIYEKFLENEIGKLGRNPTAAEVAAAETVALEKFNQVMGALNVVKFPGKKPTQQSATTTDDVTLTTGPTNKGMRDIISRVQKRIFSAYRFNTVHVFENAQDFLARAADEFMIAPNGQKVSLARWMIGEIERKKLEHPHLQNVSNLELAKEFVRVNLTFRAAVNNPYRALIVFRERIGSEREFLEVLEHEYIVHMGLKALFPNEDARRAFLQRAAKIPGMNEKVKQLIHNYPTYGQRSDHLSVVEEVLAFHSMEGPLALEMLLSAPEATDQKTKRTLWEDFKQLVKDWIGMAFAGFRATPDDSMDKVVAALREHAMTGTGENLDAVLTAAGVPLADDVAQALNNFDLQQTAAASPPVSEILYGDDPNAPARSYTPPGVEEYLKELYNTARDTDDLVTKMKELAKKAGGTSFKEKWRALLREIEPTNNMALRSVLMEKMLRIMHNTIKVARRIMTKRLETRQYLVKDARVEKMMNLWSKKPPVGATPEQLKAYGRLAIVATMSKLPLVTDEVINKADRLMQRLPDGRVFIDRGPDSVFEQTLKKGTMTKAEFLAGVDQYVVDDNGDAHLVKNEKVSQETIDLGYDIYVSETRHMAEGILETLEHTAQALNDMSLVSISDQIYNHNIKQEDAPFVMAFLDRARALYIDIAFHDYYKKNNRQRGKQAEMAHQVVVELMRAMHNKDKVKDWLDLEQGPDKGGTKLRKHNAYKWRVQENPSDEVKPFVSQMKWFLDNDPATGTPRLERLNSIGITGSQQVAMLASIQSIVNMEADLRKRENTVIQSVLGNYVEFTRKGKWRVAVRVLNADGPEKGEPASISSELYANLPVIYPKDKAGAEDLHEKLQESLDSKATARNADGRGVFTINNAEGDPINVTFEVSYGMAPGLATLTEAPNIRQFLEVAKIMGLVLSATQMKEVANLIESADARKRYGLQRSGTPGMDAEIIHNNSATLTKYAWFAATASQAWGMNRVFDDKRNIKGDWNRLAKLQRDFDIANTGAPLGETPEPGFVRDEDLVFHTEKRLLHYANQLKHMADVTTSRRTVDIRTTKGKVSLKIEPESQAHRIHAEALKRSLEKGDLELNLNDLISKTGPLRAAAVFSQLGSIASGLMQPFSLITHLPAYLGAKHEKTGYGEGHSASDIITGIYRALKEVSRLDMNDSLVIKEMLEKAKRGEKSELTVEELEFLYEQTLDGLLMPQQTYSLTGNTEGNIQNVAVRMLFDLFMAPFSLLEAMGRRATALVIFRLSKDRTVAARTAADFFKTHKLTYMPEPDFDVLEAVERTVNFTQGDYTNINRARGMRGDYAQYFFMYKMFPIMTQTMIYNLPTKQQAIVLGVLFLLGGLKGEPFADDFMDIYDTILQKLGVRHNSLELQLVQALEDVMPGLSKYVMYGGIDAFAFGGTLSTRISMGDVIPLTGAFREGADLGREIQAAFGPAFSANVAALDWAGSVADMSMQSLGMKPRTGSWETVFRNIPQSQIRGWADAASMGIRGQILDPDGRTVSDEVTAGAIFMRALGFYPLEATRANTAVRLDRMHRGYMQAVRARFILGYATAYRDGDEARMESIADSVRRWNEAAEAGGQDDMLIRNFRQSAIRAGQAAGQTTIGRTSEGAPNYSVIDEIAEAMLADEEVED
jgi:hypothetical protein